MGYTTLKAALDAVVKTNGRQEITGANLNGVMTSILQGVDILDRANPEDTSGLNHIVLKKNKTFAEQVTGTNTIYEIRDAFDLGGASVTIPTGCVLHFNGGSLSNGSIAYQNTIITGRYDISCSCTGLIANEVVSPKMFGARGDGSTDDTSAFNAAQACPGDVFVESGNYLLTNFVFSSSQRWEFKRSNGSKWWENGAAIIVTGTGVRISNDPKIYNLVVKYQGSQSDISQRPCGIYMTSHWAELYGVFVSYFRIGMAFGKPCQTDLSLASAHVDYTRVHNLQSWYNYQCGVSLDGGDSAQVNFISFFDCNVGANGVSVHDRTIQPDTTRGYGFYIASANSIYINNADVSANETCGIYIDANATTKVVRGLHVSTIYAEHNKYCDIYYNNGQDSSTTRTGDVSIKDAFFFHNSTDQYYVGRVYAPYNYPIYPSVKFLEYPTMRMEEGWYNALELWRYGMPPGQDNRMSRACVILKPGKKYRLIFTIMPKATGNITLQWGFKKFRFDNTLLFYNDTGSLSSAVIQNIPVTTDVEKVFEIYLDTPVTDVPFVTWNAGGYGADSVVTDFHWEDLTNKQVSGTTAQRPAIANVTVGFTYFDITLGKMLVSNGTDWVNMDGTALA